MQLPLSVLTALESLINPLLKQAVAQEGAAAAALESLQGNCIEFQVSGLDLQFKIQISNDGLYFYRQTDEPADAWILASPQVYLKMATSKDANSILFGSEVTVGGNTYLLEVLQELIAGLGLDTKELISRVAAPLPIASIQAGFSQLLQFGQRFTDSASADVKSYIDDEVGLLVGKNSWHLAEDELHDLRLDVDRLEARIHLLEKQLTVTTAATAAPTAGEE
ncbi:MAG TPA: SCP2 sterol-binding domain-containing protein [Marinospirillum sp.]|uniref:ubiquinone biosynthesis accessory factor UbiJ n=1 Tax=Marinospirillum sp. TaxID=2183934 RepID=UPI002B4593D1|nr:SCP2 sterol-binding domain-containing protein [Marinospirillum sp.]HKM14733.1 SCP2 sterol-binding domain-containing protein [Marinospirillum sp.]